MATSSGREDEDVMIAVDEVTGQTDPPHGELSRGPTWAIIAGGGTAGHVLPAISIGRALVRRGHPRSSLHFVGSERGIEGRLVPAAGFSITLLPGRGIARRLTAVNAGAAASLTVAMYRAIQLVRRRRPSVIVSVGGYASVPCVVAAAVLRVPLVVAEQNAVPGLANRVAATMACAVAVSFEGTALPKAVVTGNPVRPEVLAVDRGRVGRARARHQLGLPADAKVVVATGGSLGARRLNDSVVGLAERWRGRRGIAIYHIVGTRDWDPISAASPEIALGGLWYRQVRYEDRMDLVYGAADIAVCRAGASTVAELAIVGLPAILVPLPGAPGDHQTANARALVAAGAARAVPDGVADAARLAAELDPLLADPVQLAAMSQAARSVARPDAADAVARLAEDSARG